MDREVWMRAKPPRSEKILLELDTTPLEELVDDGVYAVADPLGGTEYRVTIYRPDPKDAIKGYPINTDHYRIWENFPPQWDLGSIANQASTNVDPNLLTYVGERVFLVKEPRGDDHWLPDYPLEVLLLIEESKRR